MCAQKTHFWLDDPPTGSKAAKLSRFFSTGGVLSFFIFITIQKSHHPSGFPSFDSVHDACYDSLCIES